MPRAKIELTCKYCGDKFTHIKDGLENANKVKSYETWAKEHIDTCPECYKTVRRDEIRKEQDDVLNGIKLPKLEGSEKQIAWADTIRRKGVSGVIALQGASVPFISKLQDITSAKWWIDNRDMAEKPKGLLKLLEEYGGKQKGDMVSWRRKSSASVF